MRSASWSQAHRFLPFFILCVVPFVAGQQAQPPKPVDARLTVQVTDRSGKPVVGSSLSLEEIAGQVLLTFPADPSGKWQITVPPGRYQLKVAAADRCPGRESNLGLGAGEERKLSIALDSCLSVSGQIVDGQGKPVGGARLAIDLDRHLPPGLPLSAKERGSFVDGRAEATSGADGKFTLPPLWPVDGYLLAVTQKGHPPLEQFLDLARGTKVAGLRIVLPAGAEIRGQLVGTDDKPVPGAEAVVVELTHQRPEASRPPVLETNAEGIFRWTGLPAGRYRVEITPSAGQKQFQGPFDLQPGQRLDIGRLKVRPGSSISGRILDREGNGVAGAQVRALKVISNYRKTERRVKSAADGAFVLNGLLDGGSYLLYVKPPEGFLSVESPVLSAPAHDVELTVSRTGTVSGHVRAEDGSPLTGLTVQARTNRNDWWTSGWFVAKITDPATGAFRITDLPPEGIQIKASATDYMLSETLVPDLAEGEQKESIEIVLKPGLTISGKVVDKSNGDSISGALVGISSWVPTTAVSTDDRGEFRLTGVSAGDRLLKVQHPEFAPVDQSIQVALDRPTFVTIALGRGAALSGTVKTAAGDPVPFARIELKPNPSIFRLTGAEGRYSFEHLAAGETEVSRIGGGDCFEDLETKKVELVDGKAARLDFTIGGRVEGRVTRGGLPVAGARVAFAFNPTTEAGKLSSDLTARAGWTDPSGLYQLDGVAPGPNALAVYADGQQSLRKAVIPSSPAYTLDIALPSRLITGQVLSGRTNAPLGGVALSGYGQGLGGSRGSRFTVAMGEDGEVDALFEGDRNEENVVSAPDGSFTFWVEEGVSYGLDAFSGDEGEARAEVPARGNAPIRLVLKRKARLWVELKTPDGSRLSGSAACFSWERPSGGGSTYCSDSSDGKFRFEAEEGATGQVVAGADHWAVQTVAVGPLRPDGDQPEKMEILLARAGAILIHYPAGSSTQLKGMRDSSGNAVPMLDGSFSRLQKGTDPAAPTLEIDRLAPGTYTLEFSGGKTPTAKAVVKADEVAEIQVE